MNMDPEQRAALIADGYDPDDPALLAEHDQVRALLRAHRHLTSEPGRLRDWYRTTGLTRLPNRPGPI
ncbi:hypothetical protein HQ308_19935 [Rhodococcus sp. BP-241]|uniref:hypothetical protein n=1 Tax=Rhodococcus sp. BP-241 TaxID=2739441 RepID=UPI001C9A87AC|nr:hypothetical protein [Rhodococcus sp. BP-241]MBY6709065.1 hypothetical protein [Rhodococcus sp. BP-241]